MSTACRSVDWSKAISRGLLNKGALSKGASKSRFTKGLLAACVLASSVAAQAQGVLNIVNWSDYIGPDVVKKFEKATGIKVNYNILDSDDSMQAKLLSGRSGYDVVYAGSAYFTKQVEAGIYDKIDWNKIPNKGNLDPFIMKTATAYDAGNRYGVPYTYGAEGMVVNVTKVKEVLGAEPPLNNYDLLFKPENAAKVAKCGLALVDSSSNYSTMLAYMGRNPNTSNLADMEAAHKEMLKIRPYVKLFSNSMLSDFASGDVCVATGWAGDVPVMKRRSKESGRNYDIRFVAAKNQAALWMTIMAIPKDAANKEAAHKWINFMLDPKIAAETANHITYPTTVLPAKALVRPELINDTALYPNEARLAEFFVVLPQEDSVLRAYNKAWLRYKAGR